MIANTTADIAREDRYGDEAVLIFCDHASNAIPDEMRCLGLPSDLLETHIAWDIGAGALAEALAKRLSAGFFACGYSRLIADANRDPAAHDFIPTIADQIPVPGNKDLSDDMRADRIACWHAPYHRRLGAAIAELEDRFERPLAVSVHSFTNRLMGAGEERIWHAGLLWRQDEASAHFMIDWLRRNSDWTVGDNAPYDARVFNYSVDRHIGPRGMRHLTFEVRQDLLDNAQRIETVADILAQGVGALRKTF